MLFILYCEDNMSISKGIRARLKDEHLAYVARHEEIIVLGGAMLAGDHQTRIGSTLVLNVPDRAAAEAFSVNEPYRRAGLYGRVIINRMRRAQWNPSKAPSTPDGN